MICHLFWIKWWSFLAILVDFWSGSGMVRRWRMDPAKGSSGLVGLGRFRDRGREGAQVDFDYFGLRGSNLRDSLRSIFGHFGSFWAGGPGPVPTQIAQGRSLNSLKKPRLWLRDPPWSFTDPFRTLGPKSCFLVILAKLSKLSEPVPQIT